MKRDNKLKEYLDPEEEINKVISAPDIGIIGHTGIAAYYVMRTPPGVSGIKKLDNINLTDRRIIAILKSGFLRESSIIQVRYDEIKKIIFKNTVFPLLLVPLFWTIVVLLPSYIIVDSIISNIPITLNGFHVNFILAILLLFLLFLSLNWLRDRLKIKGVKIVSKYSKNGKSRMEFVGSSEKMNTLYEEIKEKIEK